MYKLWGLHSAVVSLLCPYTPVEARGCCPCACSNCLHSAVVSLLCPYTPVEARGCRPCACSNCNHCLPWVQWMGDDWHCEREGGKGEGCELEHDVVSLWFRTRQRRLNARNEYQVVTFNDYVCSVLSWKSTHVGLQWLIALELAEVLNKR